MGKVSEGMGSRWREEGEDFAGTNGRKDREWERRNGQYDMVW